MTKVLIVAGIYLVFMMLGWLFMARRHDDPEQHDESEGLF